MRKLLTELCHPKQWKTIASKDLLSQGYPVYGANGLIGYWRDYNHNSDVLTIGCRGTCGALNIIGGKSYINGNAMCLDELSHDIYIRYLYYYLRWYDLRKIITGTTIPQITIQGLQKVWVDYPSIKKQSEIVYVLDKVNLIIDYYQQQLQKLDDLVKARFVEMFGDEQNPFGWETVKVENVADVQVGVVIKPAQYYTDKNHGVKTFRSLNIGSMYIKDADWVYFTEEGNTKNSKSILKENDLLVVRSGAPGTACVVTSEYAGCNAVDIIIAHPNIEKVNPYYLCQYTNLPHGKKQIDEGTGGAAQQHFNVGKYNKLKLMLPPLEMQNDFERFLKQIDKSKFVVQQALDKAQLLFDSLMQQYFG